MAPKCLFVYRREVNTAQAQVFVICLIHNGITVISTLCACLGRTDIQHWKLDLEKRPWCERVCEEKASCEKIIH